MSSSAGTETCLPAMAVETRIDSLLAEGGPLTVKVADIAALELETTEIRLQLRLLQTSSSDGFVLFDADGNSFRFGPRSKLHETITRTASLGTTALGLLASQVDVGLAELRQATLELVSIGVLSLHPRSSTGDRANNELHSGRYSGELAYFEGFETTQLSRHDMLRRLMSASVCVIGLGGAGSMVAQLLYASGVGQLTLVDGDAVQEQNLPRQFLYTEEDIGRPKAEALAQRLEAHRSTGHVRAIGRFVLSQEDALEFCAASELVVLSADQPRLRLVSWIGEASLRLGFSYMAMAGSWIGPISVPFQSPCYVCQSRFNLAQMADAAGYLHATLQHSPPDTRPSFPPGPALTASAMSIAIIEHLAGIDPLRLTSRRIRLRLWGMSESVSIPRYLDCQRCGKVADSSHSS